MGIATRRCRREATTCVARCAISPEEFGKHLRAELPMWEEAVRISGARAD